ncbi:hypothetical protein O9Z70_08500 [Devosia sp. YIM 151766]|uniref:hypothetical protein n=1 Tax=Devosia sp. YIM 151766 TaxID=3017325 RepID=UPI00255C499B|nr:hypothetical protein [Devosia sp. YIM 151766]WIY51534.1 hypothetical protein O9Z70_08500 [Devosia sp. YIM 151766]
MNIPEWIKPAAYGAVAGGIVVAVIGFAWGGWVTGGSAQASAQAAADASRTDLAAAICVQNFLADENARENLEALKAISSNTQRRGFIEAGPWAIMPDSTAAVASTATLCARMVGELEPVELPVVESGEVIEEGEVIEADPVVPAPSTDVAPDADAAPEAETTTP